MDEVFKSKLVAELFRKILGSLNNSKRFIKGPMWKTRVKEKRKKISSQDEAWIKKQQQRR